MAGGLDHLVIVARDLDAQADLYRRLGFQVGSRNRHDWGTLNHIVQFEGCFLELLATEDGFQRPPKGAPVAQFVDTIVDYLEEREGLAMMVLEGFDTAKDHLTFNQAGIGFPETFYFSRMAKRPDGSDVEVAFSLAFARNSNAPGAGFFVCQQHAPDMFWNTAFQAHENGCTGIARVIFSARSPEEHRAFFEAYTGVPGQSLGTGGVRFELARSAIEVRTIEDSAVQFGSAFLPPGLETGQFSAVEFTVTDLAVVVAKLIESDIAFEKRDGRVVVPAKAAMGLTVSFVATD